MTKHECAEAIVEAERLWRWIEASIRKSHPAWTDGQVEAQTRLVMDMFLAGGGDK